MSQARPMRPTVRRRGFTLLELMVVVTLVGLLGAIAMPRVRDAQRRAQLRAARSIVSNYVTSARRSSLTRSAITRFVANGNTISVTMLRDDGTEVTILSGYDLYTQNSATLTASGAALPLTFDKHGLMRAGTSVKLLLTNVANQRDSVCVSGAGLVLRGSCR